jgi:hypothetical protein
MSYRHRVSYSEKPTGIVPPRRISAGIPVVVGTAPVHTMSGAKPINEPVLCYTYGEFAAAFAGTDEAAQTALEAIGSYTLCEFAKSHYGLYNMAPVVFINVFDPAQHKAVDETPDVTKVTSEDIVGGIDVATNARTGLELIADIFPTFRIIPGLICAPGFSQDPAVGVVMAAKAASINGLFKAMAVVDVPDTVCTKYTDVPSWKETNNYTDEHMIVCWPKVKLGDDVYHMSTHVAGLIPQTDAEYGDIPYVSPSNRRLMIDSAVANGKPVRLGLDQAEYLNGQGVIVPLNFDGGWKAFGNRTGCYPSNTDPKDAFIPVRRFFNWHGNTFVLTYFQKLDGPVTRRWVETIVDSENIRLNGFRQMEIILGGEMKFLQDENPTTDLIDGIVRFHTWMTPPVPGRQIENILEFDPNNFSTLFGG